MTLPTTATLVDYPTGAVHSSSRVLHVEPLDADLAVVLLDRTSCHPVDRAWPDQGPDLAVFETAGGARTAIRDCVVGATDGTDLYLGDAVPVRPGAEGWTFVVAHLIDMAGAPQEGDTVDVHVDAAHRLALSAGHSACHLASLALNAELSDAWSKPVATDALGAPDFDGLAIETSTIGEYGSVDVFRIGKSLRKKGFGVAALDDLAGLETRVTARLEEWLASGADIRIERDGERLTDRRRWVCELPDGVASIPCGGTHAQNLAALGGLSVSLESEQVDGALIIRMVTETVVPS